MDYEVSLLPRNLNHRSLIVLLDFDRGTTRKCSRVGGAEWGGDDRALEGIRAVHRVMRQHALGQEGSPEPFSLFQSNCSL